MEQEVRAVSTGTKSADLTMTKEYLVIKGNHFTVCNGYISKSKQTKAVKINDILSMEYITMHSKRLLMLFIILMSVVLFGGIGIQKLFSVTRKIDRTIQPVERIYNTVSNNDIDINVTKASANALTSGGLKGIVFFYILLVLCCIGTFCNYFINPFQFLLVSTSNGMIAVKRKYYEHESLDCIIELWAQQL